MIKKTANSGTYAILLCFLLVVLPFIVKYYSHWDVALPTSLTWVICVLTFIYTVNSFFVQTTLRGKIIGFLAILITGLFSILVGLWLFFMAFGLGKELLDTTTSPDGKYTIDFYLINGGATTSFLVTGELDGPLWTEKEVYHQYRMDQVTFEWINNHTIKINKRTLDLAKGEIYRLP
ncbi:DUF5412 family protein [Paraliobacillus salinarum]|uniref:DUF5412 family protein n=1 Tax=Paraliobacillus salinarum TaxID=1158996 RepID=UPI001FED10CE|nr:DUF5412 family protein [Paraliobacillus salinarum]